jgi:proline dehydrogenase
MSTSPKFDFANSRIAYRWASDRELRRAALIYGLMGWRLATRWGSRAIAWGIRHGMPIAGLVRSTLFRQFCAGESLRDGELIRDRLAKFGVGVIFDYAVEGAGNEASWRTSYEEILRTVEVAAKSRPGFAVFKTTALCSPQLLRKISSKEDLCSEDERMLGVLRSRIDHIAQLCQQQGVALLVDAEESWLQDAIDRLSLELIAKYNREAAVVYLTVQMYRHDRMDFLTRITEAAERQAYFLGIKLVRGAYLEQENRRAAQAKQPSPLHPSKQATDLAYDGAIKYCLAHNQHVALFLGTHNMASCLLAAELLTAPGYQEFPQTPTVFSQLFGMSEFLTFNLAKYGFKTYKYVPYGPLEEAIPYLIRRAEENSAIDSQLPFERQLLAKELRQRRKPIRDSADE